MNGKEVLGRVAVITGIFLTGCSGPRWNAEYCADNGCPAGTETKTFNGNGETCPETRTVGAMVPSFDMSGNLILKPQTIETWYLKGETCYVDGRLVR